MANRKIDYQGLSKMSETKKSPCEVKKGQELLKNSSKSGQEILSTCVGPSS